MNGAQLIAKERERQQRGEGYDWRHDDNHDHGEIALAAAVYALPVEYRKYEIWVSKLWRLLWPHGWPFKGAVDIQSTTQPLDSRIRELVKAGALVAAEIDRLQRIQQRARRRAEAR